MPLPSTPFLYFQFGGAMPGGEAWRTGFHVALDTAIAHTAVEMNAIVDDARARLISWWAATGGGATMVNPGTSLIAVAARYYEEGHLEGSADGALAAVAGSGTVLTPNYQAQVLTLHTDTLTRSGRGRMYFPATGLGVSSATGCFALDIANRATAMASLLNSFNSGYVDESAEGRVAVLSSTQGVIRPVLSYSLDNRPDTQRGRIYGVRATAVEVRAAVVE